MHSIIHQDLYRYNLRFSYEWAMPYWNMAILVFATGWFNIIIAMAFQFYLLRYRRREAEVIAYVNWRISWRNIFAMLVKLDTRKLEFGIGNPYGKSVVLEVEPQKRRVSMLLHPYEKEFVLQ